MIEQTFTQLTMEFPVCYMTYLNFTPISESGKRKLQEKVAPSRSAWQNFLRSHEDSVTA